MVLFFLLYVKSMHVIIVATVRGYYSNVQIFIFVLGLSVMKITKIKPNENFLLYRMY